MQTAKTAAASAKEVASNIAASAKSGMDKTKATVQEKREIMTARDPVQKGMATEKKEQLLHQAEWEKAEAREINAAQKQAATGQPRITGHPTGPLPGHGIGHVTEGVVGSHPTGTGTTVAGHNTKTGGGTNTGGAYR